MSGAHAMPKPEQTRLVLIDGSGYIFRAFFALPPLTDSNGLPVGAVFGFPPRVLCRGVGAAARSSPDGAS